MSGQPGLFDTPEPARPVRIEEMARGAVLSDCHRYRYELTRTWDPTQGRVGWVMLNPSTADADVDDPTIRRCVAFARAWGYGGIVVRNLFALRATNPLELRGHPEPVGRFNGQYLRRCSSEAITVAAWGAHGGLHGRADAVVSLLRHYGARLHHLGLTQGGFPTHPLARGRHRIPDDTQPILWEDRDHA